MHVCYLVLSHRQPSQLRRLAEALLEGPGERTVVLHHNTTSSPIDPAAFADLPDVRVVPWAEPVEWGDWSLAQRSLAAVRWTVAHVPCDWVVVLSGQDYPVRPSAELAAELAGAQHDAMFMHELVDPVLVGRTEAWRRYYFHHVRVPMPRRLRTARPSGGEVATSPQARRRAALLERARALAERKGWLTVRLMPPGVPPRVGVRPRRLPFGPHLRCYKGSAWMVVRRDALARALARLDATPDLLEHYRRTLVPEESLLATLLLNDPRTRVVNRRVRFEVWDPGNHGSPRVLTAEDVPALLRSGQHLARKVDPDAHPELLDRLDALRRTRGDEEHPRASA